MTITKNKKFMSAVKKLESFNHKIVVGVIENNRCITIDINDPTDKEIDFIGQTIVMGLKLKGYKTLDMMARDKVGRSIFGAQDRYVE